MSGQKLTFESLTQPQNLNPKDIYLLQFFMSYDSFFDTCMANCRDIEERVDTAIGLLVATCPDKKTQDILFDEFIEYKKGYGFTTAAAFTIGSLLDYVDETMQLTDQSEFASPDSGYGGKPKVYYLMELDQLLEKYKKGVIAELPHPEDRIDAATALIVARFPNKSKREKMWGEYVKNKQIKSQLNSSIIAAAALFINVSKDFELTSEAYMGF